MTLLATKLSEGSFFWRPQQINTPGDEILNLLNKFFSSNETPWEIYVDIAPMMWRQWWATILKSMSQIKDKTKDCKAVTAFFIDSRSARKISAEQIIVLNDDNKLINYINSRPLESRFLKWMKICATIVSPFSCILK